MSRHSRILPWCVTALSFFLFQLVFQKPSFIFGAAGILLVGCFVTTHVLLGPRLQTPSSRLKFAMIPTLLGWTALGFSLVLETTLGRQFLALVVSVLFILFFESLITYIWEHEAYETYSLENIAAYGLTLAVFFGSGTLLALYVLLGLNIGVVMALGAILFFMIHYEMVWISKLSSARMPIMVGVLTLLMLECMLAFALLPFHFMVAAAALTILWYLAISLTRASELKLLTKKMIGRHMMFGGMLLLVLFVIARWT